MRGAADANQDGRVTLGEAYRYAYARTSVETARTVAGAQHPGYEFRLSGQGEVVLTDLGRRDASLIFHESLDGTFRIVDRDRRLIVGEITKPAGRSRRYALAHGRYAVLRCADGTCRVQHASLAPGGEVTVRAEDMTEEPVVASVAKGAGETWAYRPACVHGVVAGAGVGWGGAGDLSFGPQAALGYRVDLPWVTLLPTVGYMQTTPGSYDYLSVFFQLAVLYRQSLPVVDLLAGGAVGGAWLRQLFSRDRPDGGPFTDVAFSYSGLAGAWFPV